MPPPRASHRGPTAVMAISPVYRSGVGGLRRRNSWGISLSVGGPAIGWVPLAPRERYYYQVAAGAARRDQQLTRTSPVTNAVARRELQHVQDRSGASDPRRPGADHSCARVEDSRPSALRRRAPARMSDAGGTPATQGGSAPGAPSGRWSRALVPSAEAAAGLCRRSA